MEFFSDDHLMHHGIKGQKWYKRRFQNADGSLTPAGRSRYSVGKSEKTEKSRNRYQLSPEENKYPASRRNFTDEEIAYYNDKIRKNAGLLGPKSMEEYEKRYERASVLKRRELNEKLKADTGLVIEDKGLAPLKSDKREDLFDAIVMKPRDERKERAIDDAEDLARTEEDGPVIPALAKKWQAQYIKELNDQQFDTYISKSKKKIKAGEDYVNRYLYEVTVTDRTDGWKWTSRYRTEWG